MTFIAIDSRCYIHMVYVALIEHIVMEMWCRFCVCIIATYTFIHSVTLVCVCVRSFLLIQLLHLLCCQHGCVLLNTFNPELVYMIKITISANNNEGLIKTRFCTPNVHNSEKGILANQCQAVSSIILLSCVDSFIHFI